MGVLRRRRRACEPGLTEAECYTRCHGVRGTDVSVIASETPRRLEWRATGGRMTGEELRVKLLEKMQARNQVT